MPDDSRTCATCPWFAPDVSGVRIVCHHASLNTANVTREGSRPSGEWWCSAHPLRQPRTCIGCNGAGTRPRYVDGADVYSDPVRSGFEHCDPCNGTGKVIP